MVLSLEFTAQKGRLRSFQTLTVLFRNDMARDGTEQKLRDSWDSGKQPRDRIKKEMQLELGL
jgi:hypothetical protein